MKITTQEIDGKSIIKIEGDLVIDSVAQARPEIVAAMATASDVQLDVNCVGECDTAGIQLLLMVQTSAFALGKKFSMFGQSDSVRRSAERIGIPAITLGLQSNGS